MGKKKAITNEALERRCWEDLAIAIILQALDDYTALDDCVPLEAIGEADDIFIRIGLALQKTAKSDSVRRTRFYF